MEFYWKLSPRVYQTRISFTPVLWSTKQFSEHNLLSMVSHFKYFNVSSAKAKSRVESISREYAAGTSTIEQL